MSIEQCRAVQSIIEHGSFSGGARALGIAPSVISMRVSAFEDALGTPLFDRSTRPPRLTEAGRVVAEHARRIVHEYDSMQDTLSRDVAHGAAMRLGVIPTVVTNILPTALIRLRDMRPAPKVTVTSALSGEMIWAVDRGDLDAALVHQPASVREGHVWLEVASQKVVVVAPAGSSETDPAALLKAHPYIRFNRAAAVAPLIEARLEAMGIEPEPTAELQSIDAIRLLVSLGFGVSIIPLADEGAAAGGLRLVEFVEPPLYRRIGFYMRRSLSVRRHARVVVEAFRQAAGEPDRD